MPLPFFLQPLLLVAYYQEQLAQWIARWLQRSNEQLFGPLEQLVAAVVILGLAMQAPPPFWTPPVLPPIIMNNTDLPPLALSPGPIPDRNLSTISTGNILLDRIYDHLPGWLQISPVNIALVLLVFNLGTMMMGDDLRKRLKESWGLFWPPWQDRRKVNSTSNSQVRFDNPESSSSNTSRKAELEKAREAKAPSADPSRSASADKTKGSEGATPDSKMVKNDDERPKEGSGLTESEKARKAKDLQSDKDRTIIEPVAKDKGKSRMEGERPGESNPASGSTPASSDKTDKTLKEPADSTSPRTLGDHESKDKAKDSSQSDTDNVTRNTSSSSRSTSGSGIDTEDDPLMSGDYRPLKSVLKKSKKKPKQSKNIHHNFFMTMRGYRPSLIPFPHGFHPKPQDPRNTLWWDNIQRSADHIMALPRVPKEPENKNEDEDKKEKKVGQEKVKGEDENKDTDKENKSKSTKSTSDEKNQGNASTNEKDKEKERAKSKAEAEAKAKAAAQKEAELKARAKAASGSSSQPDAVVRVPVDPKIQKATYLSQGILSILLYYLNPQLGFLLLTFFAWQYINSHNDLILSLRGSDLTTSSSSSPSSSRTTNSNSATSSAPLPDQGRVSPEKPEKPSNNAAKIAELEKLIKKLKSLPEISPEHKEKLQRAMIKRKQLVDEDAAATREPHSEDESNTSPKKKDGEEVDHGKGEKREKVIFVIENLEEKAKEMDDYVIKFRSIENPSEEQKSKLIKAEERRKALWKQVRTLKGNEPASMMPSTPRSEQEHANAKPQSKESREVDNLEKKARQLDEYVMKYRNIENPTYEQTAKLAIVDDRRKELWSQVRKLKGNEPTSFMPKSTDDKQQELNGKIKEIEMCIVKYKKLEDPSNDVKDKVIRAEAKRKALKKELLDLVEKTGGGSSGLTIDEKESLARPES